ncbi:peroxiredoxin family protein [Prosthecobacter sp.]|uniref:peroxiredoxin family protein n=1 Tax=Prosthecobacter sp. TaxID=1965333 RepID=UPI003783C8BA
MNRPALLLIVALMLTVCPIFAVEDVNQEVKKNTLVEVGQMAPDFTCKTTDSRTITLSALKGKAVVLYFFSTSVGACITEMQYLEKEIFQKLLNRHDFQLIAIGRGHSREELVRIGGENKITFSLVPDPKQEVYQRYFSKFVPQTVVVRKDGGIAYLASGSRESAGIADLQAALQVVLR